MARKLAVKTTEHDSADKALRAPAVTNHLKLRLDDLKTFEECELKVVSVSHSPFAKYFKERIDRLEKELKEMVSFFSTEAHASTSRRMSAATTLSNKF